MADSRLMQEINMSLEHLLVAKGKSVHAHTMGEAKERNTEPT